MVLRDDVMEKFGPKQQEAFGLAAHKENNALRSWITDFKAAIAAASSLADLQSRIAGLPDTPNRTVQQLLNAVGIDIEAAEDYSWMDE